MSPPEVGTEVIFIDRRGQSRRAVVSSPDQGGGITIHYDEVGRSVDELARHVSEGQPARGGGRWRSIDQPRFFAVEIGGPLRRRPGIHRSNSMTRIWIGPIAVSIIHADLQEFATSLYPWV